MKNPGKRCVLSCKYIDFSLGYEPMLEQQYNGNKSMVAIYRRNIRKKGRDRF